MSKINCSINWNQIFHQCDPILCNQSNGLSMDKQQQSIIFGPVHFSLFLLSFGSLLGYAMELYEFQSLLPKIYWIRFYEIWNIEMVNLNKYSDISSVLYIWIAI